MGMRKNSRHNPDIFDRSSLQKILGPDTPFAIKEAYNAIRTNLLFTNRGEACPIYAVTSAGPNEGKTLNCVNLAISFAQTDKRVLLIDGDLRKPTVNKYFGVSSGDGLSEFLAGMKSEVNLRRTNVHNLSILTGGKCPPNPAELLTSEKMKELLELFKQHFDCIFIDTPPIELVTDATVISEMITGYLFVVKSGNTEIALVKHSVSVLDYVNAKILGFLLNDVSSRSQRYYKGGKYNYAYYKKDYIYANTNNSK